MLQEGFEISATTGHSTEKHWNKKFRWPSDRYGLAPEGPCVWCARTSETAGIYGCCRGYAGAGDRVGNDDLQRDSEYPARPVSVYRCAERGRHPDPRHLQ